MSNTLDDISLCILWDIADEPDAENRDKMRAVLLDRLDAGVYAAFLDRYYDDLEKTSENILHWDGKTRRYRTFAEVMEKRDSDV